MNYVRYLISKRSVDDRALNLRVLLDFESHVRSRCFETHPKVLRIVEVGGGIGAMFIRLLRRESVFATEANVEYTIIDVKCEVLEEAQRLIIREAPAVLGSHAKLKVLSSNIISPSRKFDANISGSGGVHHAKSVEALAVQLSKIEVTPRLTVTLLLGDALQILKTKREAFDVLIGAAVLDLWELEPSLETFRSCLDSRQGISCFYFPVNFDGTTDIFPESSEGIVFDAQVENVFHSAMGRRTVCGYRTQACHTGRRLIPCLAKLKMNLTSVGGSTWVVSPLGDGSYPSDEKYFANCILDFIQLTVGGVEEQSGAVDKAAFGRYVNSHRKKLSEGRLVYVAHNIDVFGVV